MHCSVELLRTDRRPLECNTRGIKLESTANMRGKIQGMLYESGAELRKADGCPESSVRV